MAGKLKRLAGMTLIEVLIALAFLAIITAPILSMFVSGTRLTTASYKLTIAAVTAQMRMEELVGLDIGDLINEYVLKDDYNGFSVRVEPTLRDLGFGHLIEVEVAVLEGDGTVLYSLTNILNVAPGGTVGVTVNENEA